MTHEKVHVRSTLDTPFVLSDEILPSLPNPTITLYRDQLIQFNESLKYLTAIVVSIVGTDRFSRMDIAVWMDKHGTPEMIERAMQHPDLLDDIEFLAYLKWQAAQPDD